LDVSQTTPDQGQPVFCCSLPKAGFGWKLRVFLNPLESLDEAITEVLDLVMLKVFLLSAFYLFRAKTGSLNFVVYHSECAFSCRAGKIPLDAQPQFTLSSVVWLLEKIVAQVVNA
jgi:hypothetical protein